MLVARNRTVENGFGKVVALDGETVIVGAHYDQRDDGEPTGPPYIFVRDDDGGWEKQTQLLACDGIRDEFFGKSVAIHGDTALIGAWVKTRMDSLPVQPTCLYATS